MSGLVLAVKGSYKVQYHSAGPTEPPVEIDFTPPWPRIPMVSGLGEALGVDMPADLETEAARQFLLQQVRGEGAASDRASCREHRERVMLSKSLCTGCAVRCIALGRKQTRSRK